MAGQAGRDRAIEQVDPHADAGEQVVDLTDPEQVTGRLIREQRDGEAEHAVHLLLVAPQGPTDRDPIDFRRARALGRETAQVLVDAALDDPEDRLARRGLALVPVEAAI